MTKINYKFVFFKKSTFLRFKILYNEIFYCIQKCTPHHFYNIEKQLKIRTVKMATKDTNFTLNFMKIVTLVRMLLKS